MADQRNPQEASNIFHSIMKASVSDPLKYVQCDCGLVAEFVPPARNEGRKLYVTYRCANGHEFVRQMGLK